MRFPKLVDKGSLKRTGIAIATLFVLAGIVYWYQPQRWDLFERKPSKPLAKLPIGQTGLFEKGKKVVIVTAHPDDEAFYLGGTLFRLKASGAKVTLIVVTDGDKAYYPFFDSGPLRKTRRAETQDSAATVGIEEVVFMGYRDGRLSFDDEPIERLSKELKRLKPEIVLAFDPYFWPRVGHRDHRVAGEIAEASLKKIGFDGWELCFSTVAANTCSDVGKTWADAQNLLSVHKSQFHGEHLERIRAMVSQNAMDGGEPFGFDFGEAFRAVRYENGKAVDNGDKS